MRLLSGIRMHRTSRMAAEALEALTVAAKLCDDVQRRIESAQEP